MVSDSGLYKYSLHLKGCSVNSVLDAGMLNEVLKRVYAYNRVSIVEYDKLQLITESAVDKQKE